MDPKYTVHLNRLNIPANHYIINEASQISYKLPDIIKGQMTSSNHGLVKTPSGVNDSGMCQPINYVSLSLSSQQLHHTSVNKSVSHGLEGMQSSLMGDILNKRVCLTSPNVIKQEFKGSCNTTQHAVIQTLCLNSVPSTTAKNMISKESSILLKEPLPAHIGIRSNATDTNFKNLNLLHMNNLSSLLILQESNQFNAESITFSNPNNQGIFQEPLNSDNNASQKLDHRACIEKTNSLNSSKIITDLNAVKIVSKPLQYISMPTNTGYTNNVVFLDKNYLVYDPKVSNPQALQSTLPPNHPLGIHDSQYSTLSEQMGLGIFSQPHSLTMTSKSHFVNSHSMTYDHQPSNEVSFNSSMLVTPSLTKKDKRRTKRFNGQNIKVTFNDEDLVQKDNQSIYARNENNFGQTQTNTRQSRKPAGLKSNEIIFEKPLLTNLTVPSHSNSVDGSILAQILNPENFTNVEQTCTSDAQFVNNRDLVKLYYSKLLDTSEHEKDSQVILTNSFGKTFFNPEEIYIGEANNSETLEQINKGKRLTFSLDKRSEDVLMKRHLDDEFSHLVKDPMPLQNKQIMYSKCSKRTFMDCFIDFLHGIKQETLSSLTNVPITKRHDLPKYIPEFTRKCTETTSATNKSDSFTNTSTMTMPFESKARTLANTSFDLQSDDLKSTRNGRKRCKQPVKRRGKKPKVHDKVKSILEGHDPADILDSLSNGYDSSHDPLWCPKKAIQPKPLIGDKRHSRRKRSKKMSDQAGISERVENLLLKKCQEGDFLIDRKDFEKLDCGVTPCNIWKVDSGRLLQKYQPSPSSVDCLHEPTSIYSSWTEDMLVNYLFLKVELQSSKLVEVLGVIQEELNLGVEGLLNERHMLDNYIKSLLTYCYLQYKALDQKQCSEAQSISEDIQSIDNLLISYKEKIKNSLEWSPELFTSMEEYSLMTISTSQGDMCQVSGYLRADKVVQLHGDKYHPGSLLTLFPVDLAGAPEFYVNSSVAEKMRSYHGVCSLKFCLFSRCNSKLRELKKGGVCDDNLIDSSLKDESWMSWVGSDLIQTLRCCRTFLET